MDQQEKERLLSDFAAALSDELASSASDSDHADSGGPSKKRHTSPAPQGARNATGLKIQPPSRIKRAAKDASDGTYGGGPVPLLAPTDPDSSFAALEVQPWLVQSLANMAIRQPTAVQKACIPEILKGRDCIGGSKTGSGKTAAFVVPILQKFYKSPCGIFALVLTATRELAQQIADSFTAFAAPFNLRLVLVTGGRDMVQQAIDLSKMPHVVIATPGRLADHIQCSGEDTVGGLKRVRFVVLDEADRLLAREVSGSMVPDVEECLRAVPDTSKRQTLLFTATMTSEVCNFQDLSPKPDKPPAFVCDVDPLVIPSSLHQTYVQIPVTHKEHYLHVFLLTEANKDKTVILFCNRTSTVEYLHHLLYLLDHKVTSLHSKLRQQERTDNLGRFRASAARILVATDVAARGLDIPQVSMVLNYDLPRDPDDYIHRVGRAARAGRKGEAATFVTRKRDVGLVHAVEERVGRQLVAWAEEGVNLETRVLRDALKLVSEKKIEARLELEEDRKIGGQRRRGKRKLQAE